MQVSLFLSPPLSPSLPPFLKCKNVFKKYTVFRLDNKDDHLVFFLQLWAQYWDFISELLAIRAVMILFYLTVECRSNYFVNVVI